MWGAPSGDTCLGSSRVGEPDPHARFAKHDLVAGPKANASRSPRHRNGAAVPDDPAPMTAAVVMQPNVARTGIAGDVRVLPGDGQVDPVRFFGEGDVIGSD